MKRKYDKALSLEKLATMPDSEIDYTDIPKLDEEFWDNARLAMPAKKKQLTVRFDEDVIDWFKTQGKGYQSHMNAILRSYVHTRIHSTAPDKRK